MDKHQFINPSSLLTKELAPGFTARLIHTREMTVAYVSIKAGSILPEHFHINEQVTNMIEGELEMTVGGETRICEKGTLVTIPSNVPHSAVALTDCQVIDVFTPPRTDLY
jgi:quercetin dioxygenase-like cupin family protein